MDSINGVLEKNQIKKTLSKPWKPSGNYLICNQKLYDILSEVETKSKK